VNAVPAWIQVLQALLTPAIAIAVGVVAFMNWRTAHQKVMLDLFDRRVRIYEATIDAALGYINVVEDMNGSKALSVLKKAHTEARFLFGDEIAETIDQISRNIFEHRRLNRRSESRNVGDEERDGLLERASEVEDEISQIMARWTDLVLPYLKMDQRRVQTPTEWLTERNKIRLSFADEKQR